MSVRNIASLVSADGCYPEPTYDDGPDELYAPEIACWHLIPSPSNSAGIDKIYMAVCVHLFDNMDIFLTGVLNLLRVGLALFDRLRSHRSFLFFSHRQQKAAYKQAVNKQKRKLRWAKTSKDY